ncbi:MAG: DnaJ domain-containing protein [Bacteroidales bacterium]|nr:DnaJ domain-containing protein [Bacteroidales bacterium]
MIKFGKWIGAGLGWTIGGPIGALLGFAFGTLVDAANLDKLDKQNFRTTTSDFVVSLLILIASIMKSDNRVVKSELDFVKRYLVSTFGEAKTTEMLLLLRNFLKKDIPVEEVGNQIRHKMNYSSRLELLHLMYGIISADGSIDANELTVFDYIASTIGITDNDIRSIKSMYSRSTDWAYEVLEIKRNSSAEQIKKAYRQLALKNHPDRVAYLGEEIRKKAHEKFAKINEAYKVIKKERNLN